MEVLRLNRSEEKPDDRIKRTEKNNTKISKCCIEKASHKPKPKVHATKRKNAQYRDRTCDLPVNSQTL